MLRLVFICTGNICRSPMAEGIARSAVRELYPALSEEVEISSAGVAALDGRPATAGAVEAMRLRGIDIRGHAARSLDHLIMSEADLALVMEEGQGRIAAGFGGGAATRVFLLLKLGEVAGSVLDGTRRLQPGCGPADRARLLAGLALEIEERGSPSRPFSAFEVADPIGMTVPAYVNAADAMEKPILDMLKALL